MKTNSRSSLVPPIEECYNFSIPNLWKQTFNYARTQADFTLKNFLPTLGLFGFIVLAILFPPTELTFFKSIFLTSNPWFEKAVEMYIFIISLWSLVLTSKRFTLKLWLQTILSFIIHHLSWSLGFLSALFT